MLDQCCGMAQEGILLVQSGYDYTGIDISRVAIEKAKTLFAKNKIKAALKIKNAWTYQPRKNFDVVMNIYSSLGYADSDAGNMQFLTKGYQSLKQGGHYILEYPNRHWIEKNFKKNMIYDDLINDRFDSVIRKSSWSHDKKYLLQNWIYYHQNRCVMKKKSRFRLYSIKELCVLFAKSGFDDVVLLNTHFKSFNSKKDERCMMIGKKRVAG